MRNTRDWGISACWINVKRPVEKVSLRCRLKERADQRVWLGTVTPMQRRQADSLEPVKRGQFSAGPCFVLKAV